MKKIKKIKIKDRTGKEIGSVVDLAKKNVRKADSRKLSTLTVDEFMELLKRV